VRQALTDAVPPPRKVPIRLAPVLGAHEDTVRRWLTEDLAAPRKQRHTARRVWQRLLDEEAAEVAESSVRALVARLRGEVGSGRGLVAVPQTHGPAQEAEVDFGEFQAVIGGEATKLFMFVLRLSHSGKAVHVAYGNQAQESFLDGHVKAFAVLGGVPTGMIRYDNLTAAVIRVLLGRQRWLNPRFVALRSHYGYESFFCQPGLDGAHEKGGVEGEIGRFRRGHLTPMPQVASLAELNEAMAAADAADDARRIGARRETVGAAAQREQVLLRPLPATPFEVSQALSCRVDTKARVCVRRPTTRYRRTWPVAGSRCGWARTPSTSWPTAGPSPRTCVACTRAPKTWCWTITWRCWPASPARWPARRRWSRRGRRGRSPRSTNGSGTRPDTPWATARAPVS